MQMPVMDGITATRRIRETTASDVLPILAMTANAMQRDRERCLDAGMNGFITKPIHPQALWRSLLECTRIRPGMGRPEQTMPSLSAPRDAEHRAGIEALMQRLRHVPELDVDLGLARTNANPGFYISMLRRFVPTQRDTVHSIQRALTEGNSLQAERLAHTLKGVAAHLGALELQRCASLLETNIRTASAPDLQASLRQLANAQERLLRSLRAAHLVKSDAVSPTTPLDAHEQDQALAIVAHMKSLLAQNDADVVLVWEQNQPLLRRLLPDADRIENAINDFEMERAIELLQTAIAAHSG
jgi:two-component system sensor histidine kinase/response regulator